MPSHTNTSPITIRLPPLLPLSGHLSNACSPALCASPCCTLPSQAPPQLLVPQEAQGVTILTPLLRGCGAKAGPTLVMAPDKTLVQVGRSPVQHSAYLLAWLSTSRSCSGFLELLCCSGVLGSAGCWVGTAGSPWPSLRAPGLPCQASSPSLVTTFFSQPAKSLWKNQHPYGASAMGPALAHLLQTDTCFRGLGRFLSQMRWEGLPKRSPLRPPPVGQFLSLSAVPTRTHNDFQEVLTQSSPRLKQ